MKLLDAIIAAPVKGPNKQYDLHHFNPMFCNDYGGFESSGPKGRERGYFTGRSTPSAWRDEVLDNFSFGVSDGGAGRDSGLFGGGKLGPNMENFWNQMGVPTGSNTGRTIGSRTTETLSYGGSNLMMGSANGSNAGNYMFAPSGDKPPMGPGMGRHCPPMMNLSLGGYQGGPGGGMSGTLIFMGGPVRLPMKPGHIQPVPIRKKLEDSDELFLIKACILYTVISAMDYLKTVVPKAHPLQDCIALGAGAYSLYLLAAEIKNILRNKVEPILLSWLMYL